MRTVSAYTLKTKYGAYKIPTPRQRPILLMGPPGIGKTAIMSQIASACNIGLVSYTMTHHTRQSAIGLPVIEKRQYGGKEFSVTGYTMSEIIASVYDQAEFSGFREGILFLDEINCVSETLMPAMLQFLQYKSFGGHKLPEGWIIVSAGNPIKYNNSAKELDMVTLDRLKLIEIEEDLDVWKRYASERGVHPAVISYLTLKPESFYAQSGSSSKSFVTARAWDDLSETVLVYEQLGLPADLNLFRQYIQHKEIAEEFSVFYELSNNFKEKYDLEDILNKGTEIPALKNARFDERLCVITLLLDNVRSLAQQQHNSAALQKSTEYFIDALEAKLKSSGKSVIATLEDMRASRLLAMEKKKSLGLMSSSQEDADLSLLSAIDKLSGMLTLSRIEDHFLACSYLRSCATENDDALTLSSALCKKLTNLYDFVLKTFGDSQEKIILITELRSGFLGKYVQAHLPHIWNEINSLLEFDKREAQLMEKISKL